MKNSTISGNGFRLSVITERLLRVEVEKGNRFIDIPTQRVTNRQFSQPAFTTEESGVRITVRTDRAVFVFDKSRLRIKSVTLQNGRTVTRFGKGNLKGTRRTLDGTNGPVPLADGLISTSGVSVLDDSTSLQLGHGGEILPRETAGSDLYYFAYGQDYRGCIQDFFRLSGQVPLVPRFALGNWWSRYKAYTQEEYIVLMQRFIDEKIPITVATVDMDWHWVDVRGRFGKQFKSGWTGYSWNTDLFPDYQVFLRWLKDHNFKVTLNLHPADGVAPFEDRYEAMAKEMGVTTGERIPFDIADPKFVDAYFKVLHHPYEKTGVDFWWIDWQQGKKSRFKGLDPLWALNYYHYRDNREEGKRPLILSRYAGVGSHRFPLGFSGDTTISWRCLNFQPYFTANATNVGYTWWSHDIAGHHMGRRDDELYLRWIQFGIFSPIMRLHSTSNEFMGKEPWKFRYDVRELTQNLLRLRHRLIPYIYSMNSRTHRDGIALIEPIYYQYPGNSEAYGVKNQYFFGSELIVAPITRKTDPRTNMACVKVWLPKGRYTDIFNGYIYEGGKTVAMYRGIENIPVLAKEGAIIPMASEGETNDWRNPADMTVQIYRGNNTFRLYEDQGEDNTFEAGVSCITEFAVAESKNELKFVIHQPEGDVSHLPAKRNYTLQFRDIASCDSIEVVSNGIKKDFSYDARKATEVCLRGITPDETIEVTLKNPVAKTNDDLKEQLIECISKFQCSFAYKKRVFGKFIDHPESGVKCKYAFFGPITELLNLKR